MGIMVSQKFEFYKSSDAVEDCNNDDDDDHQREQRRDDDGKKERDGVQIDPLQFFPFYGLKRIIIIVMTIYQEYLIGTIFSCKSY